ncbi:MAG: TonB family protein [Bacteroidales bacterium]|nr:TonB family protein [Bacteroidales bacterium]
MIHWMLFSTLATALFYGFYCLAFRRDRWLQLSRVYLIIALFFSLVYPLVQLPEVVLPVTAPAVEVGAVAVDPVAPLPPTAAPKRPTVLPAVLYLAGVALALAVLLGQLAVQVARLRRQPRLMLLDDNTSPHSFFNHIIIGTRGLTEEELQCILAHEQVHVRQRHTLDVLLMRLMCCVAWFNPFAWLMLRELRRVHEYLADEAVLSVHGREGYLGLLYRQATGTGYGHITNNFQSINIKKRIVMMNKQKTRFGAWKLLAVLPVAALLLMVGCKPTTQETVKETDEPMCESVLPDNEEAVLDVVEVDPQYPGGIEALYKYLAENIRYPEQAKADGVQGRVFVRFIIEADGSVTNAQVMRGIGGGCDEEALRVVNAMPKWKPGIVDGKPVRVNYTLPIIFKLGEK